jgi:ferredoxin-NADP reductase
VARAAVPGRLSWHVATIKATSDETETARTLVLDVPGWPGHLPGQHVDARLTAEDGYSTDRSYSIASPPEEGRLELTIQRLADGEVSPYLAGIAEPGTSCGPSGFVEAATTLLLEAGHRPSTIKTERFGAVLSPLAAGRFSPCVLPRRAAKTAALLTPLQGRALWLAGEGRRQG